MMQKSVTPTRLLATLSLCAALAAPAFAANEGRAVGVDPDASALGSGVTRTLVVGTDVSVGERINTGPRGQVQLVFVDQTRLVVGPGSSLLIETYLLRGGNSAERVVVNALGGTFRFISGNSPSSAYQINTPSATIGVRGTAFDVFVARGLSGAMVYTGAVEFCANNTCVLLTNRCELAIGGNTTAATLFSHEDSEREEYVPAFRYARFQTPLLPEFRVSGANLCYESTNAIIDGIAGSEDAGPYMEQTTSTPSNQTGGRQVISIP
jgi:hypothetical protein